MFEVLEASILVHQVDKEARVSWLESLLEEEPEFIEWLESRINSL